MVGNSSGSALEIRELAAQLRAARVRLLLSQEEVAELTGLSVRTVRNLETAKVRVPHPSSLRKLVTALELSDGRYPGVGGSPPGGVFTVPNDISDFAGRRAELEALLDALARERPELPIVALSGAPGVGKSAIAIHAAHRLRQQYCDGQLFVHLGAHAGSSADPHTTLGHLLGLLGVGWQDIPQDLAGRAELYRQLLADRRMLVVLDSVADAAQARPLLPGTASAAVILTSRRRLAELEGARHQSVGPFNASDAVSLLERMLGVERVAAERAAANWLVAECDYLPLAVRICGAKLLHRPHRTIAWLAGRLDARGKRLSTLVAGQLEVRNALLSAYQSLDESARLTLRVLAQLDLPDYSVWVVAAALDEPVDRCSEHLDVLAEASLLQPLQPDAAGQQRFRVYDLVKEFALERVESEDPAAHRTQRAERATLAAWLRTAAATAHLDDEAAYGDWPAGQRPWPIAAKPTAPDAALAWLLSEAPSLVALVRLACRSGSVRTAWGLARALQPYFDAGGHDDLLEVTHQGLREAAREHNEPAAEACALIGLADVLRNRGLYRESLRRIAQARRAALRSGSARAVAVTEHLIASTHRILGDLDAAMRWVRRAVKRVEPLEDNGPWLAACYQELGGLMFIGGDAERAVATLQIAAQRSSVRPPNRRSNVGLLRLAQAYRSVGHLAAASECLHAAIDATRDLADLVGEGYLFLELGELQRVRGDTGEAVRTLTCARHILGRAGRPTGEAIAARRLSQLEPALRRRVGAEHVLETLDLRADSAPVQAAVVEESGALRLYRCARNQDERVS